MTRIIYPERLAGIAAGLGLDEDEFFQFPPDRDHEDIFGESDLLRGVINPGCVVVTSFLDPDRFAHWITGNEPAATIPQWVAVISRHHPYFITYAFLGCLRYLMNLRVRVRCVVHPSDAHMVEYFMNGDPKFASHGITVEVVNPSEPKKPTKIVSMEPSIKGSELLTEKHGVATAHGVLAEVVSSHNGTTCAWMGLPCSIPSEWMPSIASLLDWFRPILILDVGTDGYGSTSFLCTVSRYFGANIRAIEDDRNLTKTFEKKFLRSMVSSSSASVRVTPNSPLPEDIGPLFKMPKDKECSMAVVVDDHTMAFEVAAAIAHYDEVLFIPRKPSTDVDKIIRIVGATDRPTKNIVMSNGNKAVLVRRNK